MTDETNEQAAAPAEAKTVDETVNLEAPEATEAKQETTEAKTDDAGTDDAGGEDKPRKPSGAQRAKVREARLLSELSAAQQRLEALERQLPKGDGAKDDSDKPPKEEDFNGDYLAYDRAKTAYDVRQVVREENRRLEETNRAKEQSTIELERRIAHDERVEDAREVITDYDDVMATMKGVNVRNEVIEEIISSDKSALLAYHLAKNPDKLLAMNSMSSRELAREMGRLEATVKMPAAKKQTTAPAPLTPLKGGASGSFDPVSASMEEYVAKRKAGWKG